MEGFLKKYFAEEYSPMRKGFFLAAFSAALMFAYQIILAVMLNYGVVAVSAITIFLILASLDIYFADVTKRYSLCGFLLVAMVNFVALPWLYLMRGSLFSGYLVYFGLGIIFCAVALEGTIMHVCVAASVIFDMALVAYQGYHEGAVMISAANSVRLLIESSFAVMFCGVLSGFCIKCKVGYYSIEKEKAERARAEAEVTNEAKNVFLSNMSHEIRTPMNAILGTSQLLMGSDIDEMSKDRVLNILNACNALLSSVNDLLAFAKIESDRITIDKDRYNFKEILSDIVNMISVRVMDKGIDFLVYVDKDIPDEMYGDSKKIRQILINLLNNSVKYTKKGSITLYVKKVEKEGRFELFFAVKDTGIGIADKDKPKLFNAFERVDNGGNSLNEIEGTGLGLAICKEIVDAMDGTLGFDSTFGEGSEFFFSVPQELVSWPENNADKLVDEGKERYALVYEKDEKCNEMLMTTLEQCGVRAESVCGVSEFRSLMLKKKFTHVFVARSCYTELDDFVKKNIGDSKLIVLADINQTNVEGCPGTVIVRPAYYYNISALFGGTMHTSLRKISVTGDFVCPGVRVMAVDDNLTNLQVVESLLERYEMEVFTASGGEECLYRLETQPVDLIFLDYMMPEMDGVDTFKNIRAMNAEWAKTVPIIALTANAVDGVREMLLGEGFDEYLSKPIEIGRLEKAILTYLPDHMIKPVIKGEENA